MSTSSSLLKNLIKLFDSPLLVNQVGRCLGCRVGTNNRSMVRVSLRIRNCSSASSIFIKSKIVSQRDLRIFLPVYSALP